MRTERLDGHFTKIVVEGSISIRPLITLTSESPQGPGPASTKVNLMHYSRDS